jgi:glycosyltransferase involved in cell wall biosynthesis
VRILCLSHSGGVGGAERCLVEAIDSLAERGHEVHVVLPEDGPLRQSLTSAAGVKVCWSNRWVTGPVPPLLVRGRWLMYNALDASRAIADLARRIDADLLLTNTLLMPAGAFAARRAGLPHVWFLHEFGIEDHELAFHFRRRPTLALMSRLTDLFLVNSAALRRHFAQWLPSERLRQIHYAVDVPKDVPSEKHGGRFRLVLVGHLHRGKGQHDAIAAVGRLSREGFDVELDLVGSGSPEYSRRLRNLAGDMGVEDRVHFVEFRQNPLGLVAGADVALMCSRSEALGRVTVEAMKLGLPVVGGAAGATPELVRDGWNGLLYEPGDVEALSDRIKLLYNDRAESSAMGRRGQAWAMETFNREVYGSELEDAFETVATARR